MATTSCAAGRRSLLPDVEPPSARQEPRTLTTHGHERSDPWFWLRDDDRKDPEVIAYLEAENAYTKAALAPLAPTVQALFEELKGRIQKDDSSVPVKLDDYWYYSRYEGGKEYPVHCRRAGTMEADEQVILDVNAHADGHAYYSVGRLQVSAGQQHLAYSEDTVSRRIYTVRVKDLRTGQVLDDRIEGTAGVMAWAADDRTIFYVKREPETLRAYQVWRHVLGTRPSDDVLVYEEPDDTFWVTLRRSKSKRYILISSHSTLSTEWRVVDTGAPTSEPRVVLGREADHEYHVWHHGDTFYIRTNWQAPNFRLMAAPVDQLDDKSAWREVIGHRDDVLLDDVEVFDRFLVLGERMEALREIRIIRWDDRSEHYITFDEPIYTAYVGQNPSFDTPKLRFSYSSPITPGSTYEYDMVTGERRLLKQDEVLGGYDPASYATERRWARARDGQRIPVSIAYRKGFERDGTAPLYQYAYGSYGHAMDPTFRSDRISLMDRGVVVVIAHVRGGQEMGRRWYEDGKLLKKLNTFHDFIDVTEFLIDEGYAAPDRVVAAGGSAGGMLMGGIVNLRPELYRAVHAAVPFVDIVTTMLDETIPLTTFEYDEWGNPNQKVYYDYMLRYSPYDNVTAQDYPHLLVTTGLHDSQVQYWEPAKWVARLRATKTDGNLLLLETDMDTGHGGASGRFKRYEQTAREYAFLLFTLGLIEPGASPAPQT